MTAGFGSAQVHKMQSILYISVSSMGEYNDIQENLSPHVDKML